jgi:aspartate-semialdehyde dehydrogenase
VEHKKGFRVVVVGATGLVGSTTLSILQERKFPIDKLYLVASSRSAGESCEFDGNSYEVQDIKKFDFSQTQICFFCTGNDVSAEYAPQAAEQGNIVIDKSSYFRYHQDVPLVVPEVNAETMKPNKKIIANPNCTTIPITVALKPIYDDVGITRINIATYQAVSGSGKDGVQELADQTVQLLNSRPISPKTYPQQIAFNLIPHIDEFQENGYTKEEMKLVWEIKKILNDTNIMINPTAVRVPVFYGHAAAVHIETQKKITAQRALELLSTTPGVKVIGGKFPYPTPVNDAAGKDVVYVGRIREDISHPCGLDLWIVADNLRKGAALNAVQIAEKIIANMG